MVHKFFHIPIASQNKHHEMELQKFIAPSIERKQPDIFNTDQGSQFTSDAWVKRLQSSKVKISMDGKGCYYDNIYAERLWRTIKYEEVYLNSYDIVDEAHNSISKYILFYNTIRPHQALNYCTPAELYLVE